MISYVSIDSVITALSFGHVWTDDGGTVHATVRLGDSRIYFDDPAKARALAAVCTEAAVAMEAEAAPKPPATLCPICGAALEPSGVCKVCTAVPIGEYPVSELACGDMVQDAVAIAPGTPMVCEEHGDTQVIAAPTEVTR